jgi:hypothetical protein
MTPLRRRICDHVGGCHVVASLQAGSAILLLNAGHSVLVYRPITGPLPRGSSPRRAAK